MYVLRQQVMAVHPVPESPAKSHTGNGMTFRV